MRPLLPFALAAGLFAAGLSRDAADLWIDRTTLPPLTVATGVEVTARDGTLLRAFTVAGDFKRQFAANVCQRFCECFKVRT